MPMRDVDTEGLLDFRLVEHGEVWPMSRGGVVFGADRVDLARVDASQMMNGAGEIVPRADPLVGEVEDARLDALFDDGRDGLSQVVGIGGRTYLVDDDAELLALLSDRKSVV